MPQRQPKKGRLWLNDGSCVRLRPEHPNHVWSYEFVEDRTHNGRKFRMLATNAARLRWRDRRVHPGMPGDPRDRRLRSTDVIDVLSDRLAVGPPGDVVCEHREIVRHDRVVLIIEPVTSYGGSRRDWPR